MTKGKLFFKLTAAHIKRLKSYIPQLILSVVILLAVCLILAGFVTKKLFSEQSFTRVQVGYYLPDDEDLRYNTMALSMMDDMESISEVAALVRVSSEQEGYELLENGDILFFIIVPERFFSGIMDSTNPRLTIAIQNYDTVTTYIANELLLAYARYLGVAQAGIYSALDTIREDSSSSEDENRVLNNTNIIYLERALNHTNYLEAVDAKDAGDFTLLRHYISAAIILTLCFSGFILSLWLLNTGKGVTTGLAVKGVNKAVQFLSEFAACIPAVYLAYLVCLIAVWFYSKSVNPTALVSALPAVILISFFISLVCRLSSGLISANLVIFFLTLLFMYIGGGLVPEAFLPEIIRNISPYLPGEHLIKLIAAGLFS